MNQSPADSAPEVLSSATAGVVLERRMRALPAACDRARTALVELSAHINEKYRGLISAHPYEQSVGERNMLHWFVSLSSLESHDLWARLPDTDERWRKIVAAHMPDALRSEASDQPRLDQLFTAGGIYDTILIPQSFGMYGTADESVRTVVHVDGEPVERFAVPTAAEQADQREPLDTSNAGLVMHRTGQLTYANRGEGRAFARGLAENWNRTLDGIATIYLYEEAFAQSDRVHWLIHLRDIATYYNLMGFRARVDPAARELFTKQWVPQERGGGGWEALFVESSLVDLALAPVARKSK